MRKNLYFPITIAFLFTCNFMFCLFANTCCCVLLVFSWLLACARGRLHQACLKQMHTNTLFGNLSPSASSHGHLVPRVSCLAPRPCGRRCEAQARHHVGCYPSPPSPQAPGDTLVTLSQTQQSPPLVSISSSSGGQRLQQKMINRWLNKRMYF